MTLLFITGIYLAGFIISASWKSWRLLCRGTFIYLPCCVASILLVLGVFGGAGPALLISIPMSLLVLGYLVGAIARSILLITVPRPRIFTVAVLGLSIVSMPFVAGLWFIYTQ